MCKLKNPQEFLPLTPLWFQILAAVADRPNHGYGIIKELEGRPGNEGLATGPVYLALRRMAEEGLIEEASAPDDADPRRKHYRITKLGRQAAQADAARMASLIGVALEENLVHREQLGF